MTNREQNFWRQLKHSKMGEERLPLTGRVIQANNSKVPITTTTATTTTTTTTTPRPTSPTTTTRNALPPPEVIDHNILIKGHDTLQHILQTIATIETLFLPHNHTTHLPNSHQNIQALIMAECTPPHPRICSTSNPSSRYIRIVAAPSREFAVAREVVGDAIAGTRETIAETNDTLAEVRTNVVRNEDTIAGAREGKMAAVMENAESIVQNTVAIAEKKTWQSPAPRPPSPILPPASQAPKTLSSACSLIRSSEPVATQTASLSPSEMAAEQDHADLARGQQGQAPASHGILPTATLANTASTRDADGRSSSTDIALALGEVYVGVAQYAGSPLG
ncbi:hypothetical protein DFH27DRAFT_617097 [Peziza echinospora]|nr:hypothetical protein DFH27DRAFT_617097 [Peziza echinospora]